MSGSIVVFERERGGSLSVRSSEAAIAFEFLIWCKSASPVLAGDAEFDPASDYEGLGGALKYLTLVDLSNETVAEIGRLMLAASDPSHPFWAEDSRILDLGYVERQRKAGVDMDTECLRIKTSYQALFRDVARLIDERVGDAPPSDHCQQSGQL